MKKKIKAILKKLLLLLCRHPFDENVFNEYAKPKYKYIKGSKSRYTLRYDIWEERTCGICGKVLCKTKLRSNLTEWEVEKRFGKWG